MMEVMTKPIEVEITVGKNIAHLFCYNCFPIGTPRGKTKCGIEDVSISLKTATQRCVICEEIESDPCPYCGTLNI